MTVVALPLKQAEELLASATSFVVPAIPLADTLKLSLVLPTYQEACNISAVIERTAKVLDPVLGSRYEIIVVDDDSADGTWRIALEASQRHPQLRVIRRRGERGLASAVFRGWQNARGELLGVMDADLQHPPEILAQLLSAIEEGAQLAVGSRHVLSGGVSHWSWRRRIVSRIAQLIGLLLLPGPIAQVKDPMSGFFLLQRSLLMGVEAHPLGYKVLVEVLARAHPRRIQEIGYVFEERPNGQSKIAFSVYRQYLQQLFSLRSGSRKNGD